MDKDEYLTVEQLADLLQVSPQTVYRWATTGEGPRRVKVGRYNRYRPQDVREWADTQTVGGQAAS